MSNEKKTESGLQAMFATIVIPVLFVVAVLFYIYVLGNPANFEGGNTENHPIKEGIGKWFATIYKGGFIVPILIAINLIIITFSIERAITVAKAKGKGRVDVFIRTIRTLLINDNIEGAIAECDKQKGSCANVLRAGLTKYKFVKGDHTLDKEAKIAAIQKELEEAVSLELPMLSKNLVIISTCASISTLIGLIGTVLGMIRAFSALAGAGGAPDAAQLSTGISEALINTAFGIIGSCIAIVMYNYFTNKIDQLTYGIDEANFSVVQSFASKN
jgi:biopolymer transport protein ExbB